MPAPPIVNDLREDPKACAVQVEDERNCGKPGVVKTTANLMGVPIEVWICDDHGHKLFGDMMGLFS